MFSFHRPKIYRSVAGCCICKAKSSSSRFTDSKKYENEFKDCFNLVDGQERAGEICNACVLLIKRWKKLPKGTERNWNHVVDARAGPGGKSQLRQKLKTQSQKPQPSSPYSSNCNNNNPAARLSDHGWMRRAKRRKEEKRKRKRMNLMDKLDTRRNDENEETSPPSPTVSDVSDTESPHQRTHSMLPDGIDELPPLLTAIIDTSYWKMERICCGTIFKGLRSEVMIHPKLIRPCPNSCLGPSPARNANQQHRSSTSPSPSPSVPATVISPPHEAVAVKVSSKRNGRQDSVGSEDSNNSIETEEGVVTMER